MVSDRRAKMPSLDATGIGSMHRAGMHPSVYVQIRDHLVQVAALLKDVPFGDFVKAAEAPTQQGGAIVIETDEEKRWRESDLRIARTAGAFVDEVRKRLESSQKEAADG